MYPPIIGIFSDFMTFLKTANKQNCLHPVNQIVCKENVSYMELLIDWGTIMRKLQFVSSALLNENDKFKAKAELNDNMSEYDSLF